jgi:hypothetical protein
VVSWELTLLQNGGPVFQRLTENDGNVISVTVTARMSSLMPAWLRWLPAIGDENQLTVRAEQRRPGRKAVLQTYLSRTP